MAKFIPYICGVNEEEKAENPTMTEPAAGKRTVATHAVAVSDLLVLCFQTFAIPLALEPSQKNIISHSDRNSLTEVTKKHTCLPLCALVFSSELTAECLHLRLMQKLVYLDCSVPGL